MFNFKYTKPASEIVEKAKTKAAQIRAKIEERQGRIAALRAEYEIDDAALVQLLQAARKQQRSHDKMSYSYSQSNARVDGGKQMEEKTIGAGVVNNLLTENDFIEAEKEQVKTLDLMIRNLKPIPRFSFNGTTLPEEEFTLTSEELVYLGF